MFLFLKTQVDARTVGPRSNRASSCAVVTQAVGCVSPRTLPQCERIQHPIQWLGESLLFIYVYVYIGCIYIYVPYLYIVHGLHYVYITRAMDALGDLDDSPLPSSKANSIRLADKVGLWAARGKLSALAGARGPLPQRTVAWGSGA
jgi:hypothetical protein